MAQTVVTTDDLDGSSGAETVKFSFDGVNYEIDLSKKNRTAFAKAVKPYVDAARKASGRSRSSSARSRRGSRSNGRRDLAAIREWARDNGIEVSDRGRISADVIAAFDNAK